MIIKECAYYIKEPDLISDFGTCNLFPIKSKYEIKYNACELIPISKCPYKMYMAKRINKEELNNQIKKLVSKRY